MRRRTSGRRPIAIVEPNGQLVYYAKMDDTQYGSMKVALNKATSAAMFRRPTVVFHDLLAKGAAFTYLLQLEGANSVPGGIPIVVGGKIVGGIGCSGVTGAQDIEICRGRSGGAEIKFAAQQSFIHFIPGAGRHRRPAS